MNKSISLANMINSSNEIINNRKTNFQKVETDLSSLVLNSMDKNRKKYIFSQLYQKRFLNTNTLNKNYLEIKLDNIKITEDLKNFKILNLVNY